MFANAAKHLRCAGTWLVGVNGLSEFNKVDASKLLNSRSQLCQRFLFDMKHQVRDVFIVGVKGSACEAGALRYARDGHGGKVAGSVYLFCQGFSERRASSCGASIKLAS